MHIPDGYLGPKTCGFFYASMLFVWYVALRHVEKKAGIRQLPLVAFASAAAFVIMMFNFPIPGGSAGHIVGGAVASCALGPWAGVLAMSTALFMQAILFGDGGITAFGANSFNMAFAMSFSGYYIFRFLSNSMAGGGGRGGSKKIWLAAFFAGYVSINIAALLTALELGVQPLIEHDMAGMPLYAPYPLSITLPAMVVPHLLFFGPIEGFSTALIVSYLVRKNEQFLFEPKKARISPLWALLFILILFVPLGLIYSKTPWGEWGRDELKTLLGYVPEGLSGLHGMWRGLFPGYAVLGVSPFAGYIISAFLGSVLIVFFIYLLGRLWKRS